MLAFLSLFGMLRRRRSPLSPLLRALVSVRVSQVVDCAFCVDLNASMLAGADATDRLADVGGWRESLSFTPAERLVLEYAEGMTATPPVVTEVLMDRLKAIFDAEAIVELTAVVAFQNMSARFNNALDARAHGFCAAPRLAPAVAIDAPDARSGQTTPGPAPSATAKKRS
jgi:AhpD family alkylhydroperoxidase